MPPTFPNTAPDLDLADAASYPLLNGNDILPLYSPKNLCCMIWYGRTLADQLDALPRDGWAVARADEARETVGRLRSELHRRELDPSS